MRRRRAAAPFVLALVALAALAVAACGQVEGSRSAAEDHREAGRFVRVQTAAGVVLAGTGRAGVEVGTDPLRFEVTLDGRPLVRSATDGPLYLVRDGAAVPVVSATVGAADERGISLDVAFADGGDGTLDVLPVAEGAVRLALTSAATGAEAWGVRLASPAGERLYGVTERVSATPGDAGTLDLRGERVELTAQTPPVGPTQPAGSDVSVTYQSSAGYGLVLGGAPAVVADLAAADTAVVDVRAELAAGAAAAGSVHLLVGPSHPELLHEQAELDGYPEAPTGDLAVRSGPSSADELRAELVALQRAAFLGDAFRPFAPAAGDAGEEVVARSLEVASVAPVVAGAPDGLDDPLSRALVSYQDALAAEAEDHGLTPVRPLVFRYPEQPEAADRWDQWMLGEDLLVAPVWEAGVRRRSVWFPPGRWADVWDPSTVVDGPIELVVDAPLGRLPLYVAAGTDLDAHLQEAGLAG